MKLTRNRTKLERRRRPLPKKQYWVVKLATADIFYVTTFSYTRNRELAAMTRPQANILKHDLIEKFHQKFLIKKL